MKSPESYTGLFIDSWLGKGLIKATPEALWQTIVNPYTRYIHDEMLKDVSVISDLGNGMKLGKTNMINLADLFYLCRRYRLVHQNAKICFNLFIYIIIRVNKYG